MKMFLQTLGYANTKTKLSWVIVGTVLLGFGSASFAHSKYGIKFNTDKDSTEIAKNKTALVDNVASKLIDYSLPIQISLNPLAAGFTQDYLAKQAKEFENMKVWGKKYFDLYDRILPQYGLPKELKYLSVIESSLNASTISWAGAVGPWQLMSDEGRRFGLRMSGYIDERKDFYKSTHAAAKLLRELYETFDDWLLVLAAYNGGVGRVKQAIKKANSKNFWDLQYFLPTETRNHVKKFIATHYFFEGSGGWTTMTADETNKYLATLAIENNQPTLTDEVLANTSTIEISGRYLSVVVTTHLGIDLTQFNNLNPGFDKTLAEGKTYELRLPKDKLEQFNQQKSQILLQSVRTLLNS